MNLITKDLTLQELIKCLSTIVVCISLYKRSFFDDFLVLLVLGVQNPQSITLADSWLWVFRQIINSIFEIFEQILVVKLDGVFAAKIVDKDL